MVRRTELTPELVNRTQPPDQGEIRIADTKCDGFGLRVWRTPGGVGRAFDLRAKDASGRSTRRTYKPRHGSPNLTFARLDHLRGTFGFYLEDAREWAEEERFRIIGLPTPQEVAWEKHRHARAAARASSLLQNAKYFLEHGRTSGWSDAYCDGIDALLHMLPGELLHASLGEIEAEHLVRGLVAVEMPAHRVLKLREFISKMSGSEFLGHPAWQLRSRESSDLFEREFKAHRSAGIEADHEAALEFLPKVLKALDEENELRSQANALQLYFATGSKQAPILRARWSMIISQVWYPYFPDEQSSWYLAREELNSIACEIIRQQKRLVADQFSGSPFLFPSEMFDGKVPISSFDRCWQKVLKKAGWNFDRDGSPRLRNFAAASRQRTYPAALASSWFYRNFSSQIEDPAEKENVRFVLSKVQGSDLDQ
jgi:hypothetical protein